MGDYTLTQPLTKVFTPPASCQTKWTYEGSYYNSVTGGVLIQQALEYSPDSNCFPTSFEGFGRAPSITNVYSPGACPIGYTTAGNAYNGAITMATCCLSDFDYYSTVSDLNYDSSTGNFQGCTSMYPSGSSTEVPARAGDEDLSTTTVSGPITMWAQPIWVAYRQQDVSLFTTTAPASRSATTTAGSTSTTSAQSSSPASIAAATAPSSPSATSTSGPSSSSLSTGAIAGIAIAGVAVLGIAIGLAIFFRRRKNRTPNFNSEPAYTDGTHEKQGRYELPPQQQQWPSELDGQRQPQEMPARGNTKRQPPPAPPVELDTGK